MQIPNNLPLKEFALSVVNNGPKSLNLAINFEFRNERVAGQFTHCRVEPLAPNQLRLRLMNNPQGFGNSGPGSVTRLTIYRKGQVLGWRRMTRSTEYVNPVLIPGRMEDFDIKILNASHTGGELVIVLQYQQITQPAQSSLPATVVPAQTIQQARSLFIVKRSWSAEKRLYAIQTAEEANMEWDFD